jgi:hypothetical protein
MQVLRGLGLAADPQQVKEKHRGRHKELSRAAQQERVRRERSEQSRWRRWDAQQAEYEANNSERLDELTARAGQIAVRQHQAKALSRWAEWAAEERAIKAVKDKEAAVDAAAREAAREAREAQVAAREAAKEAAEALEAELRLKQELRDVQEAEERLAAARAAEDDAAVRAAEEALAREKLEAEEARRVAEQERAEADAAAAVAAREREEAEQAERELLALKRTQARERLQAAGRAVKLTGSVVRAMGGATEPDPEPEPPPSPEELAHLRAAERQPFPTETTRQQPKTSTEYQWCSGLTTGASTPSSVTAPAAAARDGNVASRTGEARREGRAREGCRTRGASSTVSMYTDRPSCHFLTATVDICSTNHLCIHVLYHVSEQRLR